MEKEFRGLLTKKYNSANIIVYGVPFDQNCSIGSGSNKAPDKLRELSWWLPPYTMSGRPLSNIRIYDKGDVLCRTISDLDESSRIFDDKKLKVVFGGDHSISIFFQKHFIEKVKKEEKIPVIIHIDAHCDICDIYLGSKFSHACTTRRALENGLDEDNLFMIGIREFEKDGFDYLINKKNKVHLFKSTDVLDSGLELFFRDIDKKRTDNYRLYISFDIDSLDASYAPGTGTPETCGLTPNHLRKILTHLAQFNNIECFDLVEVAPPLDSNDITSWCAIKLLYEFFGALDFKE